MSRLPRRTLLKGAAIAGALSQVPGVAQAAPGAGTTTRTTYTPPPRATQVLDDGVALRWLEGDPPAGLIGTTWGVPWPRGVLARGQALRLTTGEDEPVPVQSWPTGFWPDGSVKWTAHAIGPEVTPAATYLLRPGEPVDPGQAVRVDRDWDAVTVDTGPVSCRIATRGRVLVRSITRDGVPVATDGTLVCLRADSPGEAETGSVRQQRFRERSRRSPSSSADRSAPWCEWTAGTAPSVAAGSGCRSPCGSTSTPAATASGWCTPSCSTATRRTSSAV